MNEQNFDTIRSNIGAIAAVLHALVDTHPDRARLAAKLRFIAEQQADMMLDSTVPDHVLARAKQMILAYATLAAI